MQRKAIMLNKSLSSVVKEQSKLAVFEVIKMTPPTSDRPIREPFSTQRKKGNDAIERDVRKLFQPITDLLIFQTTDKRLQKELKDHVRQRDASWLQNILRHLDVLPAGGRVLVEASPEIHRRARDSRGRIRRTRPIFVIDARSIDRLIKHEQSQVGTGKAGWATGAKRLGVKGIPQWILKHNAPGTMKDDTKGATPSITITNDVPHIQAAGRAKRVVEQVLANRVRAMKAQVEAVLKKLNR